MRVTQPGRRRGEVGAGNIKKEGRKEKQGQGPCTSAMARTAHSSAVLMDESKVKQTVNEMAVRT